MVLWISMSMLCYWPDNLSLFNSNKYCHFKLNEHQRVFFSLDFYFIYDRDFFCGSADNALILFWIMELDCISQHFHNIHPPICRIAAHATVPGQSFQQILFSCFDPNEWYIKKVSLAVSGFEPVSSRTWLICFNH